MTDLDEIKDHYNTFSKGGNLSYKKRLEKVRGPLKDDYDYEGYYKKYPKQAEAMLKGDPNAHFTDEFKLPNHDTFSDESIYSKQNGPEGGHWGYKNNHDTFTASDYNMQNNPNLGKYMQENEPDVVPIYKGGVLLPELEVTANKFDFGGGFDNNYGEVSPDVKHGVQHLNQPFFFNNNPHLFAHRDYLSILADGGDLSKKN